MFARSRTIVALVCGWSLAAAALAGQKTDKAQPKPPAKADAEKAPVPAAKVDPEQIAQWIKQLDDDSAKVRDRATRALVAAGKPAVAPVAQAANGKSLEVTTRAVEVLKTLGKHKDAATAKAANDALQKLAADKDSEAGRLAKAALDEQKAKSRVDPNVARRLGRIKWIGPQGAAVQIAVAGQVQMQAVNVNGDREVNVTENGRKIHIKQTKKEIVVTVTEPAKPNAKAAPKPKVYKAANADELKKKHPEAHKLYEKYAGQKAIQIGGNVGQAQAAAAKRQQAIAKLQRQFGQARKARRTQAHRNALKGLAEAQKSLQESIKALKDARDRKIDPKLLEKVLEQMEAAEKKLAAARKRLGS